MAESENIQIEENKVEIKENVETEQEATNDVSTEQVEQKATKTNPKYNEKMICDMCGKSISKKNLSTHKKTTCKGRPKETVIKVVPVKAEDVAPPKPVKLERYQSKATYSREAALEESDDESADEGDDQYSNAINQAKQLPKPEPPRVLTRVDKLRALVDQAFQ